MTYRLSIPSLTALTLTIALLASPARAHEGHEPLPTKGAVVNAQKGTVALAPEALRMLDVRTAEVQEFEHFDRGFAFASLESPWQQKAFASTQLPGRILSIHVRSGDVVRKGQLLAEIESREVELLHLEYLNGMRALDAAQQVVSLLVSSARSGSIPELRVVEAENAVRLASNSLWVLRTKASLLELPWIGEDASSAPAGQTQPSPFAGVLKILSPIDGTILQQDAVVGQYVEPNTHLFQIVDNSQVWVRLHVLEKDMARVQPGRSVELVLNAYPNHTFSTRVETISLGLDPMTQQIAAWCRLENSDAAMPVMPGMTGQATFQGSETRRRLSIPRSAVWSDGIAQYVFVETASTKQGSEFEKRLVWTDSRRTAQGGLPGESPIEYIELTAGSLFSSDRLVVQGAHELAGLLSRQSLVLTPQMADSFGIRFEPVTRQSIDRVLTLDAMVELPPMHRTRVAPQLRGTLQRILVDRSQPVRAGEVLAEVSSLEVVDLQLELLRTQLLLEQESETYTRLASAGGTISPRTLLDLQTQMEQTRLRADSLRRQLELIGFDASMLRDVTERRSVYESFPVRAATDGAIVQLLGTLGGAVAAGEELFEIHDLTQFQVRGHVQAKHVGKVALDQPVRIRLNAHEDLWLPGNVVRISPVVDALSGVQSIWMELKANDAVALRDRMLGRATIVLGSTEPQLAIPRDAVIHEGLKTYVFVRDEEGRLERRPVTLQDGDDRLYLVREGLEPGESLAVTQVTALQTAYASVR